MQKIKHGQDLVKDSYRNKEVDELKRIFPNVNLEGKYILFVQPQLWFPHITAGIKADIIFGGTGGEIEENYKIRTPFQNKNIYVASMLSGRKNCNLGIPIIFDSFSELNDLKIIEIKWVISSYDENERPLHVEINVIYKLKFKKEDGKYIYGIHSRDTPLFSYDLCDDDTSRQRYMDEFNSITLISNKNKNFISKSLKGNRLEDGAILNIIEGIKYNYSRVPQDEDAQIRIYQYYTSETIYPDTFGRDIDHN